MRPKWVNFDRRACEFNVLLFRRFKDDQIDEPLSKNSMLNHQLSEYQEETILNQSDKFYLRQSPIFVFPIWAFEDETDIIVKSHVTPALSSHAVSHADEYETAYSELLIESDKRPLEYKSLQLSVNNLWRAKIELLKAYFNST